MPQGLDAESILLPLSLSSNRPWVHRPAYPASSNPVDGDTVEGLGVKYRLVGFDALKVYLAECAEKRMLGEAGTQIG